MLMINDIYILTQDVALIITWSDICWWLTIFIYINSGCWSHYNMVLNMVIIISFITGEFVIDIFFIHPW